MGADRDHLQAIDTAIAQIERYQLRGKKQFLENELIRTWILFQLQAIGKAAAALSAETRHAAPQIPWLDLVDFRHWLLRDEYRSNVELIWAIVEQQMPKLKVEIQALIQMNSEFIDGGID